MGIIYCSVVYGDKNILRVSNFPQWKGWEYRGIVTKCTVNST